LKKLKDLKAQSKQTDIFFWKEGFPSIYEHNLQICASNDRWVSMIFFIYICIWHVEECSGL
jgi:hypothetical protein